MKVLTLFVNEFCNRKCKYCDIPKLKDQKKFDKQLFKNYLPLINKSNFDRIVITGGEVGLLDEESIELIFQIRKDIVINTNGVFLKKYFDRYKDQICSVVYHSVSEINQEIHNFYLDPKISYIIPVHHDNIKYLQDFLTTNNNITFEISPYDSKYNDNFRLTYHDIKRVYAIIRNCKNVSNESLTTFTRLINIKNLDVLRDMCNNNLFMEIDFVNGRIHNCVCSYTRTTKLPLTISNFNNIHTLLFDKPDICDTCLSVVVWFDLLFKSKFNKGP